MTAAAPPTGSAPQCCCCGTELCTFGGWASVAPVVGALFTGKVALVDGACTMADGDDDDEADDELEAEELLAGDVLGFNRGGELLAGPTIMAIDWPALVPVEHHWSWLFTADILRRRSYGD